MQARWVVLVLGLVFELGCGGAKQAAVAAAPTARAETVKASTFGFNATDATQALQAAIDSKAKKVIVDNTGQPWIVRPLKLASDQELFFEQGVEVQAKPGEFMGLGDALFTGNNLQNVTLTGYGATLRMRRADYDKPPYKKAEWRTVLNLNSCTNVCVAGLTLAESGGDGIYLGTAKSGVPNRNVVIKDVVCDRNYRQGISVINVDGLTLENVVLKDTAGTAPQAGIDFEPNHEDEQCSNVVMRNVTSQGNAGGGYLFALMNLTAKSAPISVRMDNCKSINDPPYGIYLSTGNVPKRAPQARFDFVNCSIEGTTGPAVLIHDLPAATTQTTFDHCAFRNTATGAQAKAPIQFQTMSSSSEPMGNLAFVECVLTDTQDRPPLAMVDMAGGIGLERITGGLRVERAGAAQSIVLTPELLAQWVPTLKLKSYPRFDMQGVAFAPVSPGAAPAPDALAFAKLRTNARLALYAAAGDTVKLTLAYQPFAKYTGVSIPVKITDPAEQPVAQAKLPFNQPTEVSFTAPASGLYRLAADPGSTFVQVLASTHPVSLSGEELPIHFVSTTGELWFWVPAGATQFALRVYGEGLGETVRAALIDPDGKVVEDVDNIGAPHQFEVTLPQPSAGQAWRVKLSHPSKGVQEDHYLDLRMVPPLFAGSKDGLLKPVQ